MSRERQTRATNDYVARTRVARSVATPVAERIGSWQSKIALLRGVAQRREAKRQVDLAEQLDDLAKAIAEQRQAFDKEIAGLSTDIVDHDRIRDACNALERSSQAVAKIRTMLQ